MGRLRVLSSATAAWSVIPDTAGQTAPTRVVSYRRYCWSVWSDIGGQLGPKYATSAFLRTYPTNCSTEPFSWPSPGVQKELPKK